MHFRNVPLPEPVQDEHLAQLLRLLAAVCDDDQGENPFGWSEPGPLPAVVPAVR
ncbi:hypothetical protein ACFY0N_00760 [Streptomyces vinaceus]|uniref:hypothetical protein n=1 Tax=Streptomyces vinaceus TaxID=1960 RepID=UPI0036A34BF3